MSYAPAAVRLAPVALIHAAIILLSPAVRAQHPTISPTIDFEWQTQEVPIKDGHGVDWSGSTLCALTSVQFLGGRQSFGECNVRRDPKIGWVISTGTHKYVQKCSVVCLKY
jgi:hypothetical protein